MAQLKDLIVNGPSRFIGDVYATTFTGNLAGNASTATNATNAGMIAGLSVHSGRNNEANKIVRTDGNGYLQVGYINSSSGHEKNASNPTYVWGSNSSDSYLRSYQTSSLSVNYATSSGSCSGNAATATKASYLDTGGMALYANNKNEINFGGTNTSSTIFFGYRATGSRSIPTSFIFGGSGGTARLTAGGFKKKDSSASYVLTGDGGHAAISSLSVNYANSSGSCSGNAATATNADTLDGQHNIEQVSDWNSWVGSFRISAENNVTNAPAEGFHYGYQMQFHRQPAVFYTDLITNLYRDELYFRRHDENGYGAWKQIAFLDSNVTSASKWRTARTITLTGSVTGSVSIDGSQNVSLNTTTNHTHNYLPLAGGTVTGQLFLTGLAEGASNVTDNTEILTSYATDNGFADSNGAVYRRDAIHLYNYIKSKLDSVYLPLSGGTMTGNITTKSFKSGTDSLGLYIEAKSNVGARIQYNKSTTGRDYDILLLKNGDISWNNNPVLHSGNYNSYAPKLDGTGASGTWGINISGNAATATNADKLDGVHYQNILERQCSGSGSSGTATGWFRIAETLINNGGGVTFLLAIQRTFHYTNNESYLFSISVSFGGGISITQLSGYANIRLITKIRVDWANSQIAYIDLYIDTSYTNNNYYWYTVGCAKSYTTWTANPTLVGNAYEFTTVQGCKSDRGFTGDIVGNASSATKLQNSRTIWGHNFDGTGNVSGALSGVTTINSTLYIDLSGNIGIGTASPSYKLYVNGDGYFTENIITESDFKSLGDAIIDGYVGIGTQKPAYRLDVNGTISCTKLLQTSDIKYKTNIKQIEYEEALKIIENLNPVTWDWNENTVEIGSSSGFVAQEAEEFIPNAISRDNENNLSLDYTQLHSYEIKVIQEQQKEIIKLKEKLKILEKLIS